MRRRLPAEESAKNTSPIMERRGFCPLSFIFDRLEAFMIREAAYQHRLIKKLRNTFPGCMVLKNDPNYIQGFPDLTVLYRDRWAVLEVKNRKGAHHQPNQDYYIQKLNKMSYASFIYPENEKGVLCELQQTFGTDREARGTECQQVPLDQL